MGCSCSVNEADRCGYCREVAEAMAEDMLDPDFPTRKLPVCTRPGHRCAAEGAGPCNGLPRVGDGVEGTAPTPSDVPDSLAGDGETCTCDTVDVSTYGRVELIRGRDDPDCPLHGFPCEVHCPTPMDCPGPVSGECLNPQLNKENRCRSASQRIMRMIRKVWPPRH